MLLPLEAWHRAMLRATQVNAVVTSIDEVVLEESESELEYDSDEDESSLSCDEIDYPGSWANPIDLTLEEED